MRKINKIVNVVLIFALIGVVSGQDRAYPQAGHALRIPLMGSKKDPADIKTSIKLERVSVPRLNREIWVSDNVLSPNNIFTETFLEFILENSGMFKGKRVLDLGTGSGVLAIALARAGAEVMAGDISVDAVAVAKENIREEDADAQKRITVILSDLYAAIPKDMLQGFDYVVFNHGIYAGHQSAEDSESFKARAGTDFCVTCRALDGLPGVIKQEGAGFFWGLRGVHKNLAILSEGGLWTELDLIKNVPKNWIAAPLPETEHDWVPGDPLIKVSIFRIYEPVFFSTEIPANRHLRGAQACL
ncbi:MAG: class I SAM-dependent methyltransferase [Candidatus Omnitrophota bacterium]